MDALFAAVDVAGVTANVTTLQVGLLVISVIFMGAALIRRSTRRV